jgi:hypothetical protein
MTTLSVIAVGHVHAEDLAALTPHFTRLEQLVLDIHPRAPLAQHRAEFNRAVDAASAEWMLVLREREQVTEEVAREIAGAIGDANAWAFRIPVVPYYAGRPLKLGSAEGEIRLFHKRHYLRFANKGEWDEIAVQGTIVRLRSGFQAVTFESADAHRRYLEKNAVPHSTLRRTLLFVRDIVATRAHDANTLRYIWTEAGFDKGP